MRRSDAQGQHKDIHFHHRDLFQGKEPRVCCSSAFPWQLNIPAQMVVQQAWSTAKGTCSLNASLQTMITAIGTTVHVLYIHPTRVSPWEHGHMWWEPHESVKIPFELCHCCFTTKHAQFYRFKISWNQAVQNHILTNISGCKIHFKRQKFEIEHPHYHNISCTFCILGHFLKNVRFSAKKKKRVLGHKFILSCEDYNFYKDEDLLTKVMSPSYNMLGLLGCLFSGFLWPQAEPSAQGFVLETRFCATTEQQYSPVALFSFCGSLWGFLCHVCIVLNEDLEMAMHTELQPHKSQTNPVM